LDTGYHIIHSFLAFASGGLTAWDRRRLSKAFFLPEPHTDFIFRLLRGIGLLRCFSGHCDVLVLIWRGVTIA
jgi:cell division protein FtsW (lipid II flippase)